MLKTIGELLDNFKIPIPPEKRLQILIQSYFDDDILKKSIKKVSINGNKATVFADNYLKINIKLKSKDILDFIHKNSKNFEHIKEIN